MARLTDEQLNVLEASLMAIVRESRWYPVAYQRQWLGELPLAFAELRLLREENALLLKNAQDDITPTPSVINTTVRHGNTTICSLTDGG